MGYVNREFFNLNIPKAVIHRTTIVLPFLWGDYVLGLLPATCDRVECGVGKFVSHWFSNQAFVHAVVKPCVGFCVFEPGNSGSPMVDWYGFGRVWEGHLEHVIKLPTLEKFAKRLDKGRIDFSER